MHSKCYQVREVPILGGRIRLPMRHAELKLSEKDEDLTGILFALSLLCVAPEPPMSLLCAADANNPLSYTCNWLAPTVTNGVLTGYQLTCDPQLQGIQPATETSSMISTTVSNLKNGINYTCTVQARGEGGLSLPSAPDSFYTIEIGELRYYTAFLIKV